MLQYTSDVGPDVSEALCGLFVCLLGPKSLVLGKQTQCQVAVVICLCTLALVVRRLRARKSLDAFCKIETVDTERKHGFPWPHICIWQGTAAVNSALLTFSDLLEDPVLNSLELNHLETRSVICTRTTNKAENGS